MKKYSPRPFRYLGYTVKGTLFFDGNRNVLLEAKRPVGRYENVVSLHSTTVNELRMCEEIPIKGLLEEFYTRLLSRDLQISPDVYEMLKDGSEKIAEKLIKKSLESIARLRIPSRPAPFP